MSQQNGGSASLASVETAPPTHAFLRTATTTTSGTHSSAPSLQPIADSSSAFSSSNTTRSSSTPSRRVEIPPLSAATTELLARVNGSLKGTQQRYGNKSIGWNPPTGNRFVGNNLNGPRTGTMRASSIIIELPTAPFTYANNGVPPAASSSTITRGSPVDLPRGPNNITPKPSSVPPPAASPSIATREFPADPPGGLISIAPRPSPVPPTAPTDGIPEVSSNGPVLAPPPPPPPPAAAAAAPPAVASLPPLQPRTTVSNAKPLSTASSISKSKRPTTGGSRNRKSITNGTKNKKRRRNKDSDEESVIRAGDSSSDESDVAPTATQTKSGRQVNRPSLYVPPPSLPAAAKETSNSLETSDNTRGSTAATTRKRKRVQRKAKDGNITCTRCQRGHSPLTNAIVFCDECNGAWHQLCHDPPISVEVVTVQEKEWFCGECKPVPITIVQPTVVRSNPFLAKTQPTPISTSSLIVPRAEVSAGGYSVEERRGFLSGLSHATLVELLMNISEGNRNLPMFPANLKDYQSSNFSVCPSSSAVTSTSTSVQRTVLQTNGLGASAATSAEESARPPTASAPDVSTTSSHRRKYEESSDEEPEYEFQEHRLYPRAGNGFRLPVGLDDLDILSEDPACSTFSYSLHGPAQIRAQMKQNVPIWGS
ncbi:phf1/phf2 family PHD finger domain-containing protein [Aspergillus brunneoviolaceus CBS 621.78]|uniref:Uncharacterized protein n=1 Tax=Aspergillus brunneoviolaceus CBS 621.78 TaxID=1450534 RepID=A0ACD1G858_9EURO|nr:hypothetical protein BO95DRAFT_140732 [Aspergillus brunneoviolaceus CBS 621.78]RAH45428.1 hypothetical protein BO95DRAFT_140732 [Aspergillus brunneoviolaceus CBS 621.78]